MVGQLSPLCGDGRLTRANWPGSALVGRPSRSWEESWPTFTGGIGCRGLSSRGVLVELRCSRPDGVLYHRGERDRRGSAGWMRLGERDAAGHGRSGVNGLHGYANRATECALGMPLMGTSPTGMPEAQRSARVAHPLMGRGCRRHAPQRRMRAAHNRVREVAGSPTTPCRGRRPDPPICQERPFSGPIWR